GFLIVNIGREGEAVFKHAQIEANVARGRRFPGQVGVADIGRHEAHQAGAARRVGAHAVAGQRLVVADFLVAGHAVASPQLQLAEGGEVAHKLLIEQPVAHGGRREVAPLVVVAEARRAIGPQREREQKAVKQLVVDAPKIRLQRVQGAARAGGQRHGAQAQVVGAQCVGEVVGSLRVEVVAIERLEAHAAHHVEVVVGVEL
nr:hypothetical protein [Tanacetum cinerariifolium]